MSVDLNYSSNKLLIHPRGVDGSTPVDMSLVPKTITPTGNAKVSTDLSKFGDPVLKFDGTGDYFTIAASSDFDFGTGDHTIELFTYVPSLPGAYTRIMGYDNNDSSGSPTLVAWVVEITSGNKMTFTLSDGTNYLTVADTTNIATNTWEHWACVRTGGFIYLYRNGTNVGSLSVGSISVKVPSAPTLRIGTWVPASAPRYYNGYLSNIRITKGIARYTSNFTTPSAAFPDGTVVTVGDSPITITPSSPMAYVIHDRVITGNVSVTATPSSPTVYYDTHNHTITGDITTFITPSSVLLYTDMHHRALVGNVPITVTPTSSLSYYDSHHRLITGDVSVIVTPISPMTFVLWECDILGHGFDCWLNRMSSDITGIGFDCNASIEGDWSNIANITGYGFDCNAVIESGAELIGYGFYCSLDFTINAKEYAYVTGIGFNCDPTITVLTSSNMWVTGVGFDCYAVIEGGAIINGYGFDCYPTISATVPEAINIAGLGFNCEPIISITVPAFISIVGHGFDADLWHGDVIGYGFDCTPRIAIITTVTNSHAFVVNTNTNAVSRFTNYPFANVVKLGDEYYGVGSAGFYKLTGNLDLTVAVNGTIITKDMDMGAYESKRTQYVYLNSDTQIKITPYFDSVARAIHYSSFAGRKTLLGKGNSGRYQQYKFEQIKKLIDLEFIEEKLQRQVK